MPNLLVLTAVGAGVYFGGRWLRRKAAAFQEDVKKAMDEQTGERKQTGMKDMPTLKQDPRTGVYRIDE